MSEALPGEHYCVDHQGNHSHYAAKNCTVCRLRAELEAARELVEAAFREGCDRVLVDVWTGHDEAWHSSRARQALARHQAAKETKS